MVKLLIIADDFTGALDTGVQFAKKGIETQVYTDRKLNSEAISKTAQVLVVDSETRPLPEGEAYEIVWKIVKEAAEIGIPTILKKTDSALRGNVGSELAAVLAASGEKELYFLPAYPEIRRITEEGIHYIDGVLLEESAFGKDPFEPVTCSYLPALVGKQTTCEVVSVEVKQDIPQNQDLEEKIYLFDAQTRAHMQERVRELNARGKLRLLAGCAGLASCLAEELDFQIKKPDQPWQTRGIYVACGSLNPITRQQVLYARNHGYTSVDLSFQQKLMPEFYKTQAGREFLEQLYEICQSNPKVVVNTFDWEQGDATRIYAAAHGMEEEEIRYIISACHGKIVKALVEQGLDDTILMTGGDTLMGFMKEIGCSQLHPVCEIGQGAVLSWLEWKERRLQVISKSGGYGDEQILMEIAGKVIEEGRG